MLGPAEVLCRPLSVFYEVLEHMIQSEGPAGAPAILRVNAPEQADAGSEITLEATVFSNPSCDRSGGRVSVDDSGGGRIAEIPLGAFENGANTGGPILMRAPNCIKTLVWQAAYVRLGAEGPSSADPVQNIEITILAHKARVSVWDVPSTVEVGGTFQFTAGVKCSSGCALEGSAIELIDVTGRKVTRTLLGSDPWPGTEATYTATIDAESPAAIGSHQWQVRFEPGNMDCPHETGSRTLRLNAVAAPEHQIGIEVVDSESGKPIEGATVVAHPYRSRTDEMGNCRIEVTGGTYDILISAAWYFPVRTRIDITCNVAERVELTKEPPNPRL
jgi:hypothetical protein